MPSTYEERTTANNSFEERRSQHSTLVLRQRYKWRIFISTLVINLISAGVVPSLGILLYFDLQDKQVSVRAAIRTPIYFIVSWCIADSWSQTSYTTTSFKKVASAASIIAAFSIAVTFAFHDTLESLGTHCFLGIMAGGGVRLLMTTAENIFSEYFSTKSPWAEGFHLLIIHSLGFIFIPLLVAYVAETEGIHYAILILAVMVLQTLPAIILLRKPRPAQSSRGIYLTNQPAYALLHNEREDSDDEHERAETSLSQPFYGATQTAQHINDTVNPSGELQQRSETAGSPYETAEGIAVPLFTDFELVTGSYQGKVAFSFEDEVTSESPNYDRSELFFRSLARRRANDKIHKSTCCTSCTGPISRELHPFKQPALYVGLISMIAQKAITIMTWILLPTLTGAFPHLTIHNYDIDLPSTLRAALITIVTGITSSPVILVPYTFNSFSYAGRKFTHGFSTAITAVFIYGIGKKLPELSIIALACFGLSNAISAGTLEQVLKEALTGKDHFKGHQTHQEEWGKIRGLANTVVGLIILLTTITIDSLTIDWNSIDWSLLFYMTASLQLFSGIIWIVTPSLHANGF